MITCFLCDGTGKLDEMDGNTFECVVCDGKGEYEEEPEVLLPTKPPCDCGCCKSGWDCSKCTDFDCCDHPDNDVNEPDVEATRE